MLPVDTTKFTKTEQLILEVLSDGKPHHRSEIMEKADLMSMSSVSEHICRIRKKLVRVGQTIPCVLTGRKIHYQHLRLLDISPE